MRGKRQEKKEEKVVFEPIPQLLRNSLDRFYAKNTKNNEQKSGSLKEKKYQELLKKLHESDKVTFDVENFKETMHLGLFIESYADELELKQYNCGIKIFKSGKSVVEEVISCYLEKQLIEFVRDFKKRVYKIEFLKKFSDKPPVTIGSSIDIHGENKLQNKAETFTLMIEKIHKNYLIVSCSESSSFNRKFSTIKLPKIRFYLNSNPSDCCHYSLKKIDIVTLEKRLFPSDKLDLKQMDKLIPKHAVKSIKDFKWTNKDIVKNKQQMEAVVNIFNKSSYPLPFILYGPPGTGKTSTLVEATIQILGISKSENPKSKSKSKLVENDKGMTKILVCTPSNSAADTIAKKLIQSNAGANLIRLYAATKTRAEIDPTIRNYSHIMHKKNKLEYYMTHKSIIICTLCFCTRFIVEKLKNFSYIFFDEAGQANEAQSLIPFLINEDCHYVISGDPWQLQPFVRTKLADPILGTSLLERLMTENIYKKDHNGNYSAKFIVKLLNNYRSHPSIIAPSNELFYENELKGYGQKDNKAQKSWPFIEEKFFPIIFHNNKSSEAKEKSSTSSYNAKEIDIVLRYVQELIGTKLNNSAIKSKNIGIISPFKLQKEKIKETLEKNNINGVEVGTVEYFQGREKDIIIVSTVRSQIFRHKKKKHLGFLSNSRRFNVAVTRAKALLVVIGDADVLKVDRDWRKIITFCIKNKSIHGEKFTKSQVKELSRSIKKEDTNKKVIHAKSLFLPKKKNNNNNKVKKPKVQKTRVKISPGQKVHKLAERLNQLTIG